MATWEILREGDVVDTSDGQKQAVTVAVSFGCPDHPNPDTEDGAYTFHQDVYLSVNPAARTATMDDYAADYEREYCESLAADDDAEPI